MHTQRNRIFFFCSAAAVGFAALGLHRYMLDNCFDAKGLLIAGNLPGKLLWVLCIGYAVALWAMLSTIGGDGSYEDNFPRCTLSGVLMMAAGAALILAIPDLGLEQPEEAAYLVPWVAAVRGVLSKAMTLLPYAASVSMMVLGIFRMLGKRPALLVSGLVCLFYMLMLVTNYRIWSADPKFYEYAFPMLAGVLLMLCSFHRTSCDGGVIQRRKLLFTGLSAAVCSIAALSIRFQPWFYISGALWAMGSMCSPAVLPPDPEEEEEAEDASADAPEVLDELGDVGDHDR